MKARRKRMILVVLALAVIAAASVLALTALRGNISYFYSPSQVVAHEAPTDRAFRLGGLVRPGSMQRSGEGLTVTFAVTDNAATVQVRYDGILPDLFSEGRGAVVKGRLAADGLFVAEQVLAKHDEEYLPPEVADTLQQAHTEGVEDLASPIAGSNAQ